MPQVYGLHCKNNVIQNIMFQVVVKEIAGKSYIYAYKKWSISLDSGTDSQVQQKCAENKSYVCIEMENYK